MRVAPTRRPALRRAEASASRPASVPPSFRWADRVAAAAAVACGIQALKAEGNYASAPFGALIVPAILAACLRSYRDRLRRLAASAWAEVSEYSAGGGRLPWRAALAFVALPATLVYLSNNDMEGSGDTRPVIPAASSLISRGDLDLDEFTTPSVPGTLIHPDGSWPYYLRREGDHTYSAYPSGMVPLAAPVVALSRLVGAPVDRTLSQLRLEKLSATLIAAASLVLFFWIAARLAPPATAAVATAILALGSGMFSTASQGLWQHGGIIFWSLIVVLVEVCSSGRPTRAGTIVQGIACGMLPACRLTSATFLVPFAVWVAVRSPRRAAAIVGIAAVAYLPWAAFYLSAYGKPFGPSTAMMAGSNWRADIAWPLAAVLASPSRGMLVYQPWLVVAALASVPAVRRRAAALGVRGGPAGWTAFAAAMIAAQVLMISAWRCWWGGYCWGSRLVLEAVPMAALLALPAFAVLARSRPGRGLVLALAVLGVSMQVPSVYLHACRWHLIADPEKFPDRFWSWADAPFLLPFRQADRPTGTARAPDARPDIDPAG